LADGRQRALKQRAKRLCVPASVAKKAIRYLRFDRADQVFSQYIRLRDGRCQRCGSAVHINDKGLPVSHQASHYFGRAKESTRFDERNVICLCMACHRIWGSDDREAYRAFMVKQLGEAGFHLLTVHANMYHKKDRAMAYLAAQALLKEQLWVVR